MKSLILIFLTNFIFAALIQPENNSELSYIYVLFEWGQEPDAINYNFQLSQTDDFSDIILSIHEPTTVHIEKDVIIWDNSYYWRVCPIFADGTSGNYSDIRSFNTLESKFNFIETEIINESLTQNGFTAFCYWSDWNSSIFDKYGNEIWNNGDEDFLFTEINNFGNIFGHRRIDDDENPKRAVEINFKREVLWEEGPSLGYGLDIHEFIKMPNNNYLGFYNYYEDGPIPIGSWTPLFQSIGYIADGITNEYPWHIPMLVEFDKNTEEEIWSWDALDYFSQNDYSNAPWSNALSSGKYDWLHMNSIYFDELESAIYLSFRHISRISKISYPSGDLIWNMGYESYDNSSICSDLGFTWQHYARLLDDGSLLFLDNGNHSTYYMDDEYPTTRIRKIRVIDNNYCEIDWEYAFSEDLFSSGMGSVHQLNNDNYLINLKANNGKIIELSNDGDEVWLANLNLDVPKNYRSFRLPGINPEAYSIIFDNYHLVNDSSIVISPLLNVKLYNKSSYKQPYIYYIDDSNNCFDTVNDTIVIESGNYANLVFNYNCAENFSTNVEFLVKPQYHEYAEKEFLVNFSYLDYDINNDNFIDLRDILSLISYIFNINDVDYIHFNNNYDINNDQQINLLDVLVLAEYILY